MNDVIGLLRDHGIQPTPQRIAVAECVLEETSHPTADQVWERVQKSCPTISRATVYNTLNLFVEKGLVKTQVLREGTAVFDPFTAAHHHFIDEETGQIVDIPWDAVKVEGSDSLEGLDVREYQVVMRGRRKPG
jgi:Fur family iron response transcriptional regulator